MPDYPLAPEHTWRDSHEDVVRVIQRAAETSDRVVVAGDSAGGGIALAAALTVRDRGGPQPSHLLLHAPWVDLTTSTPETEVVTLEDPWLFIGKMYAYASWWAGSEEDLGRPEVSPALADLSGLPRALMFSGTRDTLMPGCRLLARRAAEAGWDLTYVEQPGLLHVYPILPFIPEAKQAWRTTVEFLGEASDHLRVAVRRPRLPDLLQPVEAPPGRVRGRAGLQVPGPRRPRPAPRHPARGARGRDRCRARLRPGRRRG